MLAPDTHLQGTLSLDLKVHNVFLNQKGKYNIKFSICGSRGDLRKVQLYLNGSKQHIFEYEYTSEPFYQDGVDEPCQLDDNQFRFEMPEEFSEGEVVLLFESYQFTDNPLEDPFKCGEGKFLVFPCAGPMPSDKPSTSTAKDVCYNYTTQITINKLLAEEQLYVNVGHIQITVLLKIDQNEALPRNMSLLSTKMVNEAALPADAAVPSTRHLCGSQLNDVGVYEVVIQVHCACGLLSNTQGRPPQPYVSCNVSNAGEVTNSATTHATVHPTYSPFWDELLVIKVPKENFSKQELIINIIDHPRKLLIIGYHLPLEPLKPFFPYHLELENASNDSKAKLFVSLMFKTDELMLSTLQSDVFGLEVVLRQVTSSVTERFADPIVASLRIVSDSNQYRQRFVDGKQRESHVKTKKIKIPSTDLVGALKAMYNENQYNVAQVTFSGKPVQQPKWDQMFFFYGDDRWLFTPSSALVIEYFNAQQVVNFGHWQPQSPIGYSILDLDEFLLNVLKQENATMGIRVDNITVNVSFSS